MRGGVAVRGLWMGRQPLGTGKDRGTFFRKSSTTQQQQRRRRRYERLVAASIDEGKGGEQT